MRSPRMSGSIAGSNLYSALVVSLGPLPVGSGAVWPNAKPGRVHESHRANRRITMRSISPPALGFRRNLLRSRAQHNNFLPDGDSQKRQLSEMPVETVLRIASTVIEVPPPPTTKHHITTAQTLAPGDETKSTTYDCPEHWLTG